MNVEVLIALMNCEYKNEFKKICRSNNIKGQVIAANQIETEGAIIKNEVQKIISYHEKGASKNRNRLLENATGDICVFADNDTVFVDNYEKIIENEYKKNKNADMLIFYAENQNKQREKNKKIGNRKINKINLMRVRTNEITLKKETLEKIKEKNIKFDTNFGPRRMFLERRRNGLVGRFIKCRYKNL